MTKVYQKKVDNDINPVYANNASITTSNRYRHINTTNVIKTITDKGWELIDTSYAKVRKADRIGYQKHVLIFENSNYLIDTENKMQLLVTNSHDGSSSLRFNLGIFRTVCANGLVVGDNFFEEYIRHDSERIPEKIEKVIEEIAAITPKLTETVVKMKSVQISNEQIDQLKKVAAEIRLENAKNVISIDFNTIGNVKRIEDSNNDLYTVFNRVQETMIKGGIKYKKLRKKKGEKVESTSITRPIKNKLLSNIYNKKLWHFVESMVA